MLQFQALALIAYAVLSLVLPLKCRWYLKLLPTALIVLAGAKPYIYNHFGTWLDPGLPFAAVFALEALYGALVIAVFAAMVKDICCLGYFLAAKMMHDEMHWRRNLVSGIIAVIALGQGFYGTYSQFGLPEVKVERLYVKNLPADLSGLRLVQLSDLHLGPLLKGDFLDKVVTRVNELDPDLVLMTGDYIDGRVSKFKDEFAALARLKTSMGVFAVTGNHEYYSGAAQWLPVFKSYGLHFLENEAVTLQRGAGIINIAGVPDRNAVRFGFPGPDPKKALSHLPQGFTVMLTHQPAAVLEAEGADLVLAGHTHGGTMFFLQPLIGYFNAGFVSGMYELAGNLRLYVSNGTGIWSGFSCRFAVPAEITCFILLPDDGSSQA